MINKRKTTARFFPTLLVLVLIIFGLTDFGCEKDELGHKITYYKDKTGEGYVFFKFKNDSIAPIKDAKIEIKTYTKGSELFGMQHFDHINVDDNGKYSFKFVKKIDSEKAIGCFVSVKDFSLMYENHIPSSGSIQLHYSLLDNSNEILIDTIFCYLDRGD